MNGSYAPATNDHPRGRSGHGCIMTSDSPLPAPEGAEAIQLAGDPTRQEFLFQLLVNHIRDYGIIMLDPDGRVMTWNEGALAISGYEANEIVGKSFSIFYLPGDIENGKPGHVLAQASEMGRFEEESWRVRRDGAPFWVSAVVTAVRDPATGKLIAFAKVMRDITERKRADDLIAARTSALIQSRESEAFAHAVAHDLRAPIRHLSGFSEMLRKNCWETLDPQGRRYLDKISRSAERMGRLVDDLLEFSRLMRAPLAKTRVSLTALQAEVRRELEPDLAGRRIMWCVGDLPEVPGDHSMLRQVLVNLLSNAVKFTRDREQARIEIGSTATTTKQTTIFVRDNGAGFEMRYSGKLFRMFERLHSDDFEGTGVGLANVRRIVERHGGNVRAEGEVDRGATFYVTLPMHGEGGVSG